MVYYLLTSYVIAILLPSLSMMEVGSPGETTVPDELDIEVMQQMVCV